MESFRSEVLRETASGIPSSYRRGGRGRSLDALVDATARRVRLSGGERTLGCRSHHPSRLVRLMADSFSPQRARNCGCRHFWVGYLDHGNRGNARPGGTESGLRKMRFARADHGSPASIGQFRQSPILEWMSVGVMLMNGTRFIFSQSSFRAPRSGFPLFPWLIDSFAGARPSRVRFRLGIVPQIVPQRNPTRNVRFP